MRPSTFTLTCLALAALAFGGACAPAVAPAGPADPQPDPGSSTWDSTVTDPLFLKVDGTPALFPTMVRTFPSSSSPTAAAWDLGSLGFKPYTPGRTYVSLVVEALAGHRLDDPALTPADIASVTVDVTQGYDAQHSVGWTLTVARPALVPGARFFFERSGKTISVHLEGTAALRGPNPGSAPAAPAFVFQAAEVPLVP